MMLLVCSCLNVRIHGKGTDCDLEDASCLGLPENVLSDPFFESQVYRITLDLAGVTLSQKMLCKVRNIENWSVTTCACCMMDIFAKKVDDDDKVLVSSKAETNSNFITSSMNSERYSPVFKLLLPEINDNFIQNNIGIQFHNRNVDLSIELVQNQVSNYLKDEQKAMEERIRIFTEHQQTMYTNLLQKVRKNKQAMVYLMIQCKESQGHSEIEALSETSVGSPSVVNRDSANESSASTDSAFDRSDTSEIPFSETITQLNHRSLRRAISNPARSKTKTKSELKHAPASIDVGGVFDMEEFDSQIPLSGNSDNDSDDSENDTSTTVVEERPSEQSNCASSLPMSIPAFSRFSRSFVADDDDDKDPFPMAPEDIPASMRALACSVRDGTEMFGELPRRRLNTGELLAFRPC